MPRETGCHLKLNRVSKSVVSSHLSCLSSMHLLTTYELFPGHIIYYKIKSGSWTYRIHLVILLVLEWVLLGPLTSLVSQLHLLLVLLPLLFDRVRDGLPRAKWVIVIGFLCVSIMTPSSSSTLVGIMIALIVSVAVPVGLLFFLFLLIIVIAILFFSPWMSPSMVVVLCWSPWLCALGRVPLRCPSIRLIMQLRWFSTACNRFL